MKYEVYHKCGIDVNNMENQVVGHNEVDIVKGRSVFVIWYDKEWNEWCEICGVINKN